MPHLLPDIHPWWPPDQYLAGAQSNPIWQHCLPGYNLSLYMNPTDPVINPPGTAFGDGGQHRWLDMTYPSPAQASALIQKFGQTMTFGRGTVVDLQGFDHWCLGFGGGTFDYFPPTFVGPTSTTNPPYSYDALRYSTEHGNSPPFGFTLFDTNLQSFVVIVERQ